MSFQHGLNNIVTSGLILYLDAANIRSYSGSGTVWYDVSGYANNGNINNSPTFSSTNSGNFTFNQSSQYVTMPFTTILNNCTIGIWFKATSTASYQYILSLGNGTNSYCLHLDMNDPDGSAAYQTMWVYWNSAGSPLSGIGKVGTYGDWQDSTWRNYVFVRNTSDTPVTRHYMNGTEVTSNVTRTGDQTTQFGNGSGYNLYIACAQGPAAYWGGSISNVSIYNKALTASEVLQNYNTLKHRFV